MEESINRLLRILNRYPVKDVSKMFRDKEVELEIESFTKYPDVKYSDNLKKRLIQQAKRKRISPGRVKYLEGQINELNSYTLEEHIRVAIEDLSAMIENLQNKGLPNSEIILLHVEFSDLQHMAYVQAYGKYKEKWYENELGGFESLFTSAKYWDELDSRKFCSMSEQLEILIVEDQEYPYIFHQLRELRVFLGIKKAIEQPTIKAKLNKIAPNARIEIGIHDTGCFHVIHESSNAI